VSVTRRLRPVVATLLALASGTAPLLAECTPRDRGRLGWPTHAVVYFDVGRLPRAVRGQARAAFTAWNRANRLNGSGVEFIEGRGPFRVVVRKGSVRGAAAQTEFRVTRDGETTGTATIRIDLDDDRVFDDEEAGFDTAVQKVVMHEIGHTMGLADVRDSPCARTRGRSVMNGLCGVNDSGGAQPLDVTNCDTETIRALHPPARPSRPR
jgi:hypothetical protein